MIIQQEKGEAAEKTPFDITPATERRHFQEFVKCSMKLNDKFIHWTELSASMYFSPYDFITLFINVMKSVLCMCAYTVHKSTYIYTTRNRNWGCVVVVFFVEYKTAAAAASFSSYLSLPFPFHVFYRVLVLLFLNLKAITINYYCISRWPNLSALESILLLFRLCVYRFVIFKQKTLS